MNAQTEILLYEHIWNIVLTLAVFGAIFYFIRILKQCFKGDDNNALYIGRFYDGDCSSFRLLPKKTEWKTIFLLIGIYFVVRISSVAAAFFIKTIVNPEYAFSFGGMFDDLIRWDSPHYLGIAQYGYRNTGDARFHIVFYPLYPWLVKGLSYIFGGNITVAAFVEPNLFMALSIAVMYKLLRIDFSEKVAETAILLLIFNPFGFFFSIPYTESTFLFLSLLFMFMLKKENWLAAGVCGFFAALTKNFGLLLLVPYGVYFFIVVFKRRCTFKQCILKLLPAFLILAGFGVYLIVNKAVTGNWFQFMIYQKEHWNNEISCILKNVTNHFRWFVTETSEMGYKWFLWFGNVSASVITMAAIYIKHRKMPFLYNIYALAYLFLTLTVSWLLSGSRYLAASFPAYISYALIFDGKRLGWLKWPIFAAEYILGVIVLLAFISGAAVM